MLKSDRHVGSDGCVQEPIWKLTTIVVTNPLSKLGMPIPTTFVASSLGNIPTRSTPSVCCTIYCTPPCTFVLLCIQLHLVAHLFALLNTTTCCHITLNQLISLLCRSIYHFARRLTTMQITPPTPLCNPTHDYIPP